MSEPRRTGRDIAAGVADRAGAAARIAAGFTLLELVVAMAVFSLVCLGIYGVLVLGARSASSGERVTEQSRRFRIATELMTRQIASAVPISLPRPDEGGFGKDKDGSDPEPYFFGDSTQVEFVTTAPQRPDASGMAIVRYWVEEGTLQMSETPAYEAFRGDESFGKDEGPAAGARATLLFDVDSLKLGYRRDPDSDEWLEVWDAVDEDQLPAAVRLEVIPSVAAGPAWYQEAPVMVGTFNQVSDIEDDFAGVKRGGGGGGRGSRGGRGENGSEDERGGGAGEEETTPPSTVPEPDETD
ncbi:MAG: prepilin-type N-terminal cleavage/methylation domain-containing protein [Deltaproteobacteria bacterium]|nr:prepilin-type N-terminal cleavage/methylation domain-containing protein [Deltaproteobacteria bacterium]